MTPSERADLPYIILLLVDGVLFFVLLALLARESPANNRRQPECAQDSLRKHCLDTLPPCSSFGAISEGPLDVELPRLLACPLRASWIRFELGAGPSSSHFAANLPTVFLNQLGALHFGLGGVVGRRQSSPSSPIFRIMAIHST
jgi:hypothetical protein